MANSNPTKEVNMKVPCTWVAVECRKSDRSKEMRHFEKLLTVQLAAFSLFGLNIRPYRKAKFIVWVSSFLGWISCVFISVAFFLNVLDDHYENLEFKRRLARKLKVVLRVLLWITYQCSKTKLSKAFEDVVNLGRELNVKPPNKLVVVIFFAVVFLFSKSYFANLHTSNDVVMQAFLKAVKFSPSSLPRSLRIFLSWIHRFLQSVFIPMFVYCFMILYLLMCRHMTEILKDYSLASTKMLDAGEMALRDFEQCFRRYKSIQQILKKVENSTSLLILFAFLSTVTSIFICSLNFMERKYNTVEVLASSMHFFAFFFLISFVAAFANEADKFAREVNDLIQLRATVSKEKPGLDVLLCFASMNTKPPFAFSGGGFFYFTKELILCSVGCILTYALLVLHI